MQRKKVKYIDMSRLPTDYTQLVDELEDPVLDADDLLDIELKGGILEFDECLAYLMILKDDLSEKEYDYAMRIHKRGRMKATYELFEQLRKNSTAAAEMMIVRLSSVLAQQPDQMANLPDFNFNIYKQNNPINENPE